MNWSTIVPRFDSFVLILQKLFLNANNLSDNSINWEGISCLKSLAILNLSQNQ